jgi:hypothetical protein
MNQCVQNQPPHKHTTLILILSHLGTFVRTIQYWIHVSISYGRAYYQLHSMKSLVYCNMAFYALRFCIDPKFLSYHLAVWIIGNSIYTVAVIREIVPYYRLT